ncbi:outer membrane protein [Escherichia coli]|uniref:outer membrane protein n=1 Tax=Escherichia coli TaxID=562 RepID=UPI000A187B3E|nr:outer membrane beta-barrel protein [Escherichia coli]OSL96384.1 adhesin/virulence factor Hek [Escherichia coli T426]
MNRCVSRLIISSAFVITFGAASPVIASPYYLSGKAGMSLNHLSEQSGHVNIDDSNLWLGQGNQNKPSFIGAIAGGYDFRTDYDIPVRTELEYASRSQFRHSGNRQFQADDGDAVTASKADKYSIQTLMLNAYYDFYNGSNFTPYVSVGLGLARIKQHADASVWLNDDTTDNLLLYSSSNKNKFAWSVGAGTDWRITDNLSTDISYRYLNMGTVSTRQTAQFDDEEDSIGSAEYSTHARLNTHEFLLGLRYIF